MATGTNQTRTQTSAKRTGPDRPVHQPTDQQTQRLADEPSNTKKAKEPWASMVRAEITMTAQASTIPLRQAAKRLGIGRNVLFRILREKNILDKSNMPYQCYVRGGLFIANTSTWTHPTTGVHVCAKPEITDQGIEFVRNLINSEQSQ